MTSARGWKLLSILVCVRVNLKEPGGVSRSFFRPCFEYICLNKAPESESTHYLRPQNGQLSPKPAPELKKLLLTPPGSFGFTRTQTSIDSSFHPRELVIGALEQGLSQCSCRACVNLIEFALEPVLEVSSSPFQTNVQVWDSLAQTSDRQASS